MGFPVCQAKGYQCYPAVAFDGTNFLVAWTDYRNGQDWDVYAARISPDGKVLDADGFAVCAAPGNQIHPAVASDGRGRSLVVWSDVRPQSGKPETYGLACAFVAGDRPGGEKQLHNPAGASVVTPVAAYDGEGFVVAAKEYPSAAKPFPGDSWGQGNPVLLRVLPDGQIVQSPQDAGFYANAYAVAADPAGKRFLLWSNARHGHGIYTPTYMSGLFKTPWQQVSCQLLYGLQTAFFPINEQWCAAAWDGKNFVVVVEQNPGPTANAADHPAVNVDLVATRVDGETGKGLDLVGAAISDWKTGDKNAAHTAAEEAKKTGAYGVKVAASEPGVQLRHPAMASCGGGKSILVYSRHGGVEKYKIHAVLLSE
jgi:catechol 2,3-dioxygenase-like lactoylglutathione lyase family enzyme